jgi:LysM repeat protein
MIGTLVAGLVGCGKKSEGPSSEGAGEPRLPPVPKDDLTERARTYIVKKGDTLSGIAKQFHVTQDAIVEANHFKDRNVVIRVGQKIILPGVGTDPSDSKKEESPSQRPTDKEKLFKSVRKGSVPVLRKQFMPKGVKELLSTMNAEIQNFAKRHNLPLMGPALCGQGSCSAFEGIKSKLWNLSPLDAVFTDPQWYLLKYGSNSRDAFKIRETLDTLASMPESGWVRIAIRDYPKEKGFIVRHKDEGQMFHPGGLPAGGLLCYDPNPAKKEHGKGAEAWGHIEWLTKDSAGTPRYVHAVYSEVHGGSPWGRKQFDTMLKGSEAYCYAYVLVTPELKQDWLRAQQGEAGRA